MFGEHLGVLRDIAAVEVGNAEVEKDIKKVGKVEESLVGAIGRVAEQVLHLTVDAENPERFYHEVQEKQENDIFYEAFLHGRFLSMARLTLFFQGFAVSLATVLIEDVNHPDGEAVVVLQPYLAGQGFRDVGVVHTGADGT